MPNHSFTTGKPLPEIENGAVLDGWNFHQVIPHTPIFAGVSGLVFRRCNLINCNVPEDSVVEDCLRAHISHCSHLHPKWVGKGIMECETECLHMVAKEIVEIDGIMIDTIYTYEDLPG